MSEHLKAFLTAYRDWVDDGAPDARPFMRYSGLCTSFKKWLHDIDGISLLEIMYERDGLKNEFYSDGLDPIYPFGGEDHYNYLRDREEQHLNEARLAWVRAKVAQYEVTGETS